MPEETTFLQIPSLALRNNTNSPFTTMLGTNQVVGTNPDTITQAYKSAVKGALLKPVVPPRRDDCAAERIVKILLEGV